MIALPSRRTAALVTVALLGTVLVVVAHATGQPTGTTDDRLLAEVQGLRADVRRSSALTVRAHLLSSRLLLQESRINLLGSQLASVHRSIAAFEAQKSKPLDSLKRADEGIAKGLQGYDGAIAEARAELARIDRESQTVRDGPI